MPRYNYVALDAKGEESTGLLEASSTNEAIGQLRQAGYFPTNVYEEAKSKPDGKLEKKRASARRKWPERRGRAGKPALSSSSAKKLSQRS